MECGSGLGSGPARVRVRVRLRGKVGIRASLAEEADAAASVTLGQLELRGVRGARVAP